MMLGASQDHVRGQSAARFALRAHALTPRCPVAAISVAVQSRDGELLLRYELLGDQSALQMPPPATPLRGAQLWQHTCMECFLAGDGPAYREFNFSPSLAWAAYAFDSYRAGGRDLAAANPPAIAARGNSIQYTLEARLPGELLGEWPAARARRIALAAVIEDRHGQLSYWALRHPAAQPDFHHADGFVRWQE